MGNEKVDELYVINKLLPYDLFLLRYMAYFLMKCMHFDMFAASRRCCFIFAFIGKYMMQSLISNLALCSDKQVHKTRCYDAGCPDASTGQAHSIICRFLTSLLAWNTGESRLKSSFPTELSGSGHSKNPHIRAFI